jgi:hypothetical protein
MTKRSRAAWRSDASSDPQSTPNATPPLPYNQIRHTTYPLSIQTPCLPLLYSSSVATHLRSTTQPHPPNPASSCLDCPPARKILPALPATHHPLPHRLNPSLLNPKTNLQPASPLRRSCASYLLGHTPPLPPPPHGLHRLRLRGWGTRGY